MRHFFRRCVLLVSVLATVVHSHAAEDPVPSPSIEALEKTLSGNSRDRAVAVSQLIVTVKDSKAKPENRRKAVELLSKYGDAKAIDFLVEHLAMELPVGDDVVDFGGYGKTFPFLGALYEYHRDDWNLIPSILRTLDSEKDRSFLPLAYILVKRIAGTKLAIKIVEDQLSLNPEGIRKVNLESLRKMLMGKGR